MTLPDKGAIELLCNLLEKVFRSAANPWISKSVIETAAIRISEGRGISVDGAKDIYARRGRRNRKLGSPIDGFEILLTNLENTKAEEILIHQLVDENKIEYLIFTDLELTELIGVLRFPKERFASHFVP